MKKASDRHQRGQTKYSLNFLQYSPTETSTRQCQLRHGWPKECLLVQVFTAVWRWNYILFPLQKTWWNLYGTVFFPCAFSGQEAQMKKLDSCRTRKEHGSDTPRARPEGTFQQLCGSLLPGGSLIPVFSGSWWRTEVQGREKLICSLIWSFLEGSTSVKLLGL